MNVDISETAGIRAKKIAVVVHNDVKRDARILKEVRSLKRAGLDVTIFGISDRASTATYEGATIQLSAFDRPFLLRVKDTLFENQKLLAAAGIIGGGVLVALLALSQELSVTLFLVALVVVLSGLFYLLKPAIVQVLLLSYRFYNWHAIARVLARTIEPGNYDIVHSHDIVGLIAGNRLKQKYPHIHLIWDAHEIYEQQGQSSRLHRICLRSLLKRNTRTVDAFITINESIKAFYQQNYSLPPALVVMNATVYAGRVEDDGRLRKAAHLSERRKILLFQGGFTQHRGIPQLMEAARNLPHPWSIVMMGWGKVEGELRALASELEKVHGRENAPLAVLPPASQEELAGWTAGAALGIIPYEDIGLNHLYCTPNKLWEYPNAGVPILATSLVEMEKMISDWGTGFLLPRAFTGNDIIQCLNQISEADLQEKRAKCAEFSERLSWQDFEDNLLKAYDGA